MAYKTKPEIFGDGAGFGAAVPVSVSNPPGTAAGNRGVQFGEQVTASTANRPSGALADNTDDLNLRLGVFETDGIDGTYRLGASAVPGGGRLVTLDGAAIETVSATASQRAQDIANAHFRAKLSGDAVGGGIAVDVVGFGRTGTGNHLASLLDRRAITPTNLAILTATVNITLNAGGLDPDSITVGAGQVRDGSSNTDLVLGYDMVEVLSGPHAGLYVILTTDSGTKVSVVNLDGTAPSFGASVASTARFFRPTLSASSRFGQPTEVHKHAALMVSGVPGQESAMDFIAGSRDGHVSTATTPDGARHAFRVLRTNRAGVASPALTVDAVGHVRSTLTTDGMSADGKARSPDWGNAAFVADQDMTGEVVEAGFVAHSVGGLEDYYGFLAALDRRSVAAPTGVLNFTFKPGNVIDLTDIDMADNFVTPNVSLVEILTPSPQAGFYLVTGRASNIGELTLVNLLRSSITLPVGGAGTARVLYSSTMGRRTFGIEGTPFAALSNDGPATQMIEADATVGGTALALYGASAKEQCLIRGMGTEDGASEERFRLTAGGNVYAKSTDIDGLAKANSTELDHPTNDYSYTAARTRTITIGLHVGQPVGATAWSRSAEGATYMWVSDAAGQRRLVFDINPYIRHGQELVSVTMLGKPGSDPGSPNRMNIQLLRSDPIDFTSPYTAPGVPTNLLTAELDGTAVKHVTASTTPGTVFFVREGASGVARDYWIQIRSTNAAVNDELYGIQLVVNESTVRNS